jgi:hypothetical protein
MTKLRSIFSIGLFIFLVLGVSWLSYRLLIVLLERLS